MKILIVFLLFFSSCTYNLQFTQPCTKENIEIQCQEKLKKKFGNVSYEITETDSTFLIRFGHTQPNVLGASGIIELSKKDCKIIKEQFYQ